MSGFTDNCYKTDLKHALNPKVGDYWQEMLFPVCVVVHVDDKYVHVLDKLIKDKDGERFNASEKMIYTRKEFSNRYRYGRLDNYHFEATDTDDTGNHFWCNVVPEYFNLATEADE